MEQLGQLADRDCVEKRDDPVSSLTLARSYMAFVQGEQREVGVAVKQTHPLLENQVRDLAADMRRRLPTTATAAASTSMTRDIAIFSSAVDTTTRGFEFSAVVAARPGNMQLRGGEGFTMKVSCSGKDFAVLLPSGSGIEETAANFQVCAVEAMIAYQQAAASMQWPSGREQVSCSQL